MQTNRKNEYYVYLFIYLLVDTVFRLACPSTPAHKFNAMTLDLADEKSTVVELLFFRCLVNYWIIIVFRAEWSLFALRWLLGFIHYVFLIVTRFNYNRYIYMVTLNAENFRLSIQLDIDARVRAFEYFPSKRLHWISMWIFFVTFLHTMRNFLDFFCLWIWFLQENSVDFSLIAYRALQILIEHVSKSIWLWRIIQRDRDIFGMGIIENWTLKQIH